MRIFFSVGEPSGDVHGANLVRALRDRRGDVECVGYGGPKMAEAGAALDVDLTQHAVMGILPALGRLPTFLGLASRADRSFRHRRPDAVVLIDFPGFNWWIARRAKAHGIPVFYYVPPQIWAWLSYRVAKMRRSVDHILCSLPFEPEWYARRGCTGARYFGHPFFDAVRQRPLDEAFVGEQRSDARPLVAILPGSRTQEVRSTLPMFLRTAAAVARQVPGVRFAVGAYKPHQARLAEQLIADERRRDATFDVPVYLGRTPELMHAARCCLACSGSVSLELLHHAKPTVIGYRAAWWMDKLQDRLRNFEYVTLVNMLSTGRVERDREAERLRGTSRHPRDGVGEPGVLFPEFWDRGDHAPEMARHLVRWLTDDADYRRTVTRLEELRDRVGRPGASQRVADYVLNSVKPSKRPPARPHYLSSNSATTTIG